MKKTVLSILVLVALATTTLAQTYNNPESVVYDSVGKRYFISNKNGNTIIQLDSNNTRTNFVTSGLNMPKGLTLVGDTLISINNTSIQGFLLSNASRVLNVSVAGTSFMNDVTYDGKEYLYISDSDQNKIFKFSMKTNLYSTLTSSITGPNGLLFDKNKNSILICSWGSNAKIYSFKLANNSLKTEVTTKLSDLDGLAKDNCGNVYVSSWGSGCVHLFDSLFKTPPTKISTGHNGPADIYINQKNQVLAIPNFNSNTVSFVNLNMGCKDLITYLEPQNRSIGVNDTIKLDWEDVASAKSYELEYSKDSTFYSGVVTLKPHGSDTILRGLTLNTNYYWRVRAMGIESKKIFNDVWKFRTEITNSVSSIYENKISVFPNPSSGIFTLKIDEASTKNARAEVYNTDGKLVLSKEIENGIIDLSGYPKGIYTLKVTNSQGSTNHKLVKQ